MSEERRCTLHRDRLVISHGSLRQSTLLQARLAIDIQRDLLIEHNGCCITSKRTGATQVHGLLDDKLRTILGLDTRHIDSRKGYRSTYERDSRFEGVNFRVEGAMRANDLRLHEVEGVRRGIADDHAGDVEGRVVDIALGDLGVGHIDSGWFVRREVIVSDGYTGVEQSRSNLHWQQDDEEHGNEDDQVHPPPLLKVISNSTAAALSRGRHGGFRNLGFGGGHGGISLEKDQEGNLVPQEEANTDRRPC